MAQKQKTFVLVSPRGERRRFCTQEREAKKRARKREEKNAKKAKAPNAQKIAQKKQKHQAQKKSANSHFFLLPQLKCGFRAQSRMAGGNQGS
jgi:hypothetical protein